MVLDRLEYDHKVNVRQIVLITMNLTIIPLQNSEGECIIMGVPMNTPKESNGINGPRR